MSNEFDKLGTTSIAMFNIVLEAKMGAMVQMTKKMHPEFTKEQLSVFLHDALTYMVNKYE
jgi:hypothetical protein